MRTSTPDGGRDVIEGIVTAIVPGGQGLVRDKDGVVLARGGLPGERVRIQITRRQKSVRHGVVVQVLERAAERVAPDCPLHPRCGGCDLLDLSLPAAVQAREGIVVDALVRVGKIPRPVVDAALQPLAAAVVPGEALRRRARFVIRGGAATYSALESHDRVPLDRCPALHDTLNRALALVPSAQLADGVALRLAMDDAGHVSAALNHASADEARRLVERGVARGVVAFDDDGQELAVVGEPTLFGEVAPGYAVAEGGCRSDAAVFTQATRFGARAILQAVLDAAQPQPETRVLELFAGSGHLTVPLLEAGATVVAVEGAPRGVEYLRTNTARFGDRCLVLNVYIDGAFPLPTHVDVVIADPPRTGIPGFSTLLDRIVAQTAVETLVLVSCDPATGARDLAAAMGHGFALERIVPIDAFPRTSHVEWVATLRRA